MEVSLLKKLKSIVTYLVFVFVLLLVISFVNDLHFSAKNALLHNSEIKRLGKIKHYELIRADDKNYYCICTSESNKVITTLINNKFNIFWQSNSIGVYDMDFCKVNSFMIPWNNKWLVFGYCDSTIQTVRYTFTNGEVIHVKPNDSLYVIEESYNFTNSKIEKIEGLDKENNIVYKQ